MRLRWSRIAQEDLLEILRFIALDKPGAARAWVARLQDRARKIPQNPRLGRVVPELEREDVREVIERGYRIVYRLVGEDVLIVTVFEGHRLFPERVRKDLSE